MNTSQMGEYLSAVALACLTVMRLRKCEGFDEFDYIEGSLLELLTAYIDEAKPQAEAKARSEKA